VWIARHGREIAGSGAAAAELIPIDRVDLPRRRGSGTHQSVETIFGDHRIDAVVPGHPQ